MSLSNVNITINRNGLGQVAIQGDGAAGIYLQGVSVADKLELETPYVLKSLKDAEAKGITLEGANKVAFRQINEFYQTAGEGKKLFLIVSDKGAKSEVMKSCVEKLLNFAVVKFPFWVYVYRLWLMQRHKAGFQRKSLTHKQPFNYLQMRTLIKLCRLLLSLQV